MSVVTIKEQYLTDIANAIRAKSDSEDTYTTAEMAPAINALSFEVEETIDGFLTRKYNKGIHSDITEMTNIGVLQGMSIPYVEFPNVENLPSGSFRSCTNLTRADLPKLKYVKGDVFNGCSNLATVNLPAVQTIDYTAFKDCVKLRKIDLPSCTSIGTNAFYGCNALTAVILRRAGRASMTIDSFPESTWIYVPSNMYAAYTTYAEAISLPYTFRKIEDYPEVCG